MTEHTISSGIDLIDTSVADEPTLIDDGQDSIQPIADWAANHSGDDALPVTQCAIALATVVVTALLFIPVAARAACSQDKGPYTCSGNDIPVVDIGASNDRTAILYEKVTGNFGPSASSKDIFALHFWDYAADGKDATKDDHEDGQDGGDGYTPYTLTVNMHFDKGFGLDSATGGIWVEGDGGWGGDGNEDSTFFDDNLGGKGGQGGNGGKITITANADNGGATPYPITTQDGVGIIVQSQGGWGGDGGKGTVQGGPRDGYGGAGGAAGHGGDVTLTLEDGHSVKLTNTNGSYYGTDLFGNDYYNFAGISLYSTGGDGGTGGEGLSIYSGYGGSGGAGGNGGQVTLTADSPSNTIITAGAAGHGIVAISEAGDGGSGGEGNGPDKAVGGNGGAGGSGGRVAVHYAGDITTSGKQAQGILIQSLGGASGAGGDGDSWFDGNGGLSKTPGPGGVATVTYENGTISTTGAEASGILVESVGGFSGGSGGASGFVAFGGSAESAGDGGVVQATLRDATVTTAGHYSAGLVTLSVGGGGGVAGPDDGVVALGSTGGAGGTGGDVSVTLTDTNAITTNGVDAPGIFALSLGGGGGISGGSNGAVALGGQGGTGGDGGTATFSVNGDTTVTTQDAYSVGVMVSSIGGGGGKASSPKGAVALGATGGDGGEGSDATLDLQSGVLEVTTHGHKAEGVLLSSIGGGGGHGGSSFALEVGIDLPVHGASGGAGGDGGDVRVQTEGGSVDLETRGYKTNGFIAQSVGGGGGTSGNTVTVGIGMTFNSQIGASHSAIGGHGGTVTIGDQDTVGLTGSVTTHGDAMSSAILVQSVGGGGGSAGNDIQANVGLEFDHDMGTDGGIGGDGGQVTVNSRTDATTYGHHSDGMLVQSVGGGGGQASNVVDADVDVDLSTYEGNQGSSGGTGGAGGDVWVQSDSTVVTHGIHSLGIVAQSLGGGGGKGGSTIDAGVTAGLGVTLGSSGGAGGDSGTVDLTTAGSVTTQGMLSTGILAQSVAGGGGISGTTVNGNVGVNLNYTHGGDGGAGGTASDVKLTNSASVQTAGVLANGVMAQSIGGGGGSGGVTATGSMGIFGDVNVTHGGNGGAGGHAGTVSVTNTGAITATGDLSDGLFAQSLGGHGGAGGITGSGTGAAGPMSGAVGVTVGGAGGHGGTADTVDVTNSGQITTHGYSSTGITAQSIGGSGGAGGVVIAGTVSASSEGSGSVSVGVGGDGGAGGTAEKVTATNDSGGLITTTGHLSYGIFAQSVGGNGGKGGGSYVASFSAGSGPSAGASVAVGGAGGDGSIGGDVEVDNQGKVQTSGGNAHGLYAQSIGGNGGVGAYGFAFAGDFDWKPDNALQLNASVAVGGSGGTAAHAGQVTVTNSGDITTQTETAYGIYAQSVGGGGGDGGQAGSHTFGYTKAQNKTDTKKSYSLEFDMGGDSGAGGDGNAVSVTHSAGTITTTGHASYAIFAQSVGGGGGNSGNGAPGLTGWVADTYDTFEILDDMYDTYKEVKGFPKTELDFEISIGGKGGAAGNGGQVTVENDATLITLADSATAIYAQSVGGGGGSGGDGSQGLLTSITVAGRGSGGGNGGDVTVTNSGSIKTAGSGAMGIYAQSVGGGGGTAGDIEGNLVNTIANFYETLGASIAHEDDGADGGDGGDINIDITSSGFIHTTGENAHGIAAQSVGGGGGAAGTIGPTGQVKSYIGSAGGDGDGGYVDITVDGSIHVEGDGAHGVFAQSASGGDSYAGGLKIRISGSVTADGENARAILAQSSETGTDDPDGNQATNDQCADASCRGTTQIYVEKGGLVQTTSTSSYETITVLGGRSTYNKDGSINYSNMIENQGTIQSANADSVVIANDNKGALRIRNMSGGIISGSLQLDDANRTSFWSQQGATFNAGTSVYLGELGHYTGDNGSIMSPHGQGTVGTSTVSFGGTYTEAGTLWIDLQQNTDGSLSNDQVVLDGMNQEGGVKLTGEVKPVLVGGTTFSSGDKGQFKFASLKGGATLHNLSATAVSTPAVTYTLYHDDDYDNLYIKYKIDYSGRAAGADLEDNELSYANYLSRALAAIEADERSTAAEQGTAATARTDSATANAVNAVATAEAAMDTDDTEDALSMLATTILNTTSTDELEALYDHQTPDEHLIGASRAFSVSYRLNQLMQGCPTMDPAAGVDVLRQSNCAWAQVLGSRLQQDEADESPEFSETAWGLALGAQHEIAPDTFLGVTGLFETLSIDGSNFSQDGERYSLGLALKREIGRYTLSASLGAGMYALDYDRAYRFANRWQQANSEIDGRFLGAELRASALYLGERGYYTKPSAALAYTRVWQDGFSESGNGPLNWQVDSVNDGWLALTPMIELGRAFTANDQAMRAFLRAGVTAVLNDPSVHGRSKLKDADIALGTLNHSMTVDRYRGDLIAGFQAQLKDNLSVSLQAQTALSQNSNDYGGSAQLELRF
ncbi:autotransporter outer membrane beta-barrel domain-containing protein [Thiohalocapsa marina]|uniref:Autotransporter outer membrane beta-barrel domain-containing protein n=1 Tax=Thiohalocapsa marina TaxID=424902 RepID=A0A5M8FR25_9GAMM|nr:autotransporter outer membrane beta-barrel domain-containing protein [Thiohalocapsa marina]KAA6185105.1 autotransporter outer membrane beta-barrel domain-containing protein [Thiohalocapsa marina]